MLGLVNQGKDRPAERRAQPDEGADVDRGCRQQAGHKRQARHSADARDLRCVHPKAGDQPGGEHRAPAASLQEARGALQRYAGMQRPRDPHQSVPAEQREDLPSEDRPAENRDADRTDEQRGAHATAGNRDAADGEHQVTWSKGQGHPRLLDEHQGANHSGQGRPLEPLHPADRIHFVASRNSS